MARHLRSLSDLSAPDLERLVTLAQSVKQSPGDYREALKHKSVALMFSKPSTRTRVSFEVGVGQLGAQALYLTAGGTLGLQLGRGESHHDTAKVLSRYVDALVVRTFAQDHVDQLALHGSIPVVNALTDAYHPCQALADVLTMREHFGELKGRKLVFVGPGNNVTHSLMLAGPRAGFDVVCACPDDLPPDPAVLARAQDDAATAGTSVSLSADAMEAVKGASVIYADTWVSMGQEDEAEALKRKLAAYQVDARLMGAAAKDAVFLHCLPAHRGEEVTEAVIDGGQSLVFDQAENRLHAQKALLLLLLEAEPWS
jgi:ornithine carbamoyltransferase